MVLQCQKYMLKETTFQEVLVPLGEKMNIYATPTCTKGVLGPLMFFFFGFKNLYGSNISQLRGYEGSSCTKGESRSFYKGII